MTAKQFSITNYCSAIIIAIILACTAAILFVCAPSSRSANADVTVAQPNIDLGAIGATYIIGDESVKEMLGAEEVNGSSEKYGWYVFNEDADTYRFSRHDMGWASAVGSVSSANSRVRVVLASDWTAQETDRDVDGIALLTEFGSDVKIFPYGRLDIPRGTYMQLDLNGCVLDRGLRTAEQEEAYSSVIYAENSELEIVDGDPSRAHDGAFDYKKNIVDFYGQTIIKQDISVVGGIIAGASLAKNLSGAVSLKNSKFIMRGGTLTSNYFATDETKIIGAVSLENSDFYLIDGLLINNQTNSAETKGGTVALYGYSNLYMYDGQISDNKTRGVYVGEYCAFAMYGGSISNNNGVKSGAGIYNNGTVNLYNGNIQYNADYYGYGGGVYNGGVFNLFDGKISDNQAAGSRAGGIYNLGKFAMSGGIVSGNASGYDGGGILNDMSDGIKGELIVTGGEITDNVTGFGKGGGIYNRGGAALLSGVKVVRNATHRKTGAYYLVASGGGICMDGGTLDVVDGEITDNTAVETAKPFYENENSGISVYSGALRISGKPIIKNILFFNAYAELSIGALEDGANIVFDEQSKTETIKDYFLNNTYDGIPIDPSKYIHSDDASKNIVLLNDEVYLTTESKATFKSGYGDASAIMIENEGYYGAAYEYEKGSKVKYELTLGDEVKTTTVSKKQSDGSYAEHSGDIAEVGIYKITYSGAYSYNYYIAIKPRDLTDETVSATLGTTEYEYDGTAKTPAVSEVTYNGETLTENTDYEIEYRNNTDAGTGYAVIAFKGNYTGKKELPFEINITGGRYAVTWEYYDGTTWREKSDETTFEYIPGYRGNQTNKVRAKLTLSGADTGTETVRYAYADGVTEYNDATVTADNVSAITVKYELNGESASAIRNAGEYTVWLDGEADYPVGGKHETTLSMGVYEIDAMDTRLSVRLTETEVEYDGTSKRPSVKVVFDYLAMYEGVDYEVVYSDGKHEEQAVEGGTATAKVRFIGNYSGGTEVGFEIRKATNGWEKLPNIVRWTYGNFDKTGTVIIAKPKYLLNDAKVHVSIRNGNGEEIEGLTDIAVEKITDETYGECYAVSDEETVKAINALNVTRYVLQVWVDETSSYTELSAEEIMFNILKAENYWEESPSIESWITGEYEAEKNTPVSASKYGESVNVKITDETGEYVYYDSARNVNLLSSASAGLYIMTAEVKGTENYTGLTYSATFRVFAPESKTVIEQGMPWWGVLLIVLGVIAVLVAIMLILHIKGVLQLITGKMVIKMRAKADVDATIAAVRAGRMAAAATAATSSSSTTEKEEKKTEKKAQALEKKAKSPEEKAAELEAKAKAMRKKAEAMKAKAKVMVMTPEEKKAMKQEEKEREKEKNRVKSPEERAEALEKKAEQNEAQAEQLKAKAEVMKSRANEMRERAAKKKEKEQKQDEAEAPTKTRPTTVVDNEEE